MKIFHGTKGDFKEFNITGLGAEYGNMGITAGDYFTTSIDEACSYAEIKYDNDNLNGQVFELNIDDNDKRKFIELKYDENRNIVPVDSTKNKITKKDIVNILEKMPNIKDRVLDFMDIDIRKLDNNSVLKQCLSNIAENYIDIFEENYLNGLNYLGNDFASPYSGNSALDIFNKAVQEVTGYIGVKMEYHKGIEHYVFFDNNEVNKRINHIYTAGDIKELIKDLDWQNISRQELDKLMVEKIERKEKESCENSQQFKI
jgi:hypothetical protein